MYSSAKDNVSYRSYSAQLLILYLQFGDVLLDIYYFFSQNYEKSIGLNSAAKEKPQAGLVALCIKSGCYATAISFLSCLLFRDIP